MGAELDLDRNDGPHSGRRTAVLSRTAAGWIGVLLLTAAIVVVLASRAEHRPPAPAPVPAVTFQLSDGS